MAKKVAKKNNLQKGPESPCAKEKERGEKACAYGNKIRRRRDC